MKLPRYLVISLIISLALVLWSQLTGKQEPVQQYQKTSIVSRSISVAKLLPIEKNRNEQVIDLFPIPSRGEKNDEKGKEPFPVTNVTPPFPLQVVGAWWDENDRIVLLNNGDHNILFCKKCPMKGYIRPGEKILTEWRLTELTDDYLSVEWLPGKISNRIELGDLKSKPAR